MQDEGWYELLHGNVAIFMLGTELELSPGSDQYLFLEQGLASVNRSVTPWVLVLGHRPSYYVDDSKDGGTIDANINQIEPLLMAYKVDIVLWGHVHNAFRSCPVFNGTCVPPATDGGYDAPIQVCVCVVVQPCG